MTEFTKSSLKIVLPKPSQTDFSTHEGEASVVSKAGTQPSPTPLPSKYAAEYKSPAVRKRKHFKVPASPARDSHWYLQQMSRRQRARRQDAYQSTQLSRFET